MSALEPTLKPLDEKVLDACRRDRGIRARAIARRLDRVRNPWTERERRERAQLERDVRLILRGLEHLGKVTGRGGWWKAL